MIILEIYDISDVEVISGKLVIAGYTVTLKLEKVTSSADKYLIYVEKRKEVQIS